MNIPRDELLACCRVIVAISEDSDFFMAIGVRAGQDELSTIAAAERWADATGRVLGALVEEILSQTHAHCGVCDTNNKSHCPDWVQP